MNQFWQDVRYGLRLLVKSKAFTTVALLSLALGIGANSTIFTLLNALFVRELPVSDPEGLVDLTLVTRNGESRSFSVPMFEEIERQQHVFSNLFGWWGDAVFNIEANGTLSRGEVWAVTGEFYSALGVSPVAGRLISRQDVVLDRRIPQQVAVIGYSLWWKAYGGEGSAVGKTVRVEGVPFTIIGVMRKGFTGMGIATEPDVTIPLTSQPIITDGNFGKLSNPRWFGLEVSGRLKEGVTPAQARAQLQTLWPAVQATALPSDYTEEERARFVSARLQSTSAARGIDSSLRAQFGRPLYVMQGATGLILLIACVNLANLMLGRAGARRHELAVRKALGASAWRIVRQLLIECLLLSLAGAALGLIFALWGGRWLTNFMLQLYIVPIALNVRPDRTVVVSTVLISIVTALLFGLAPAWQAMREGVADLNQNSRILGDRQGRLGRFLIVAQVALSVVLLTAAGLFVRTVTKLRSVSAGFRSEGVLVVKLSPVPAGYKNIDHNSYYPELVQRIAELPGVQAASIANLQPGGATPWMQTVSLMPDSSSTRNVDAGFAVVSPHFFEVMGIPLLEGRDVEWRDDDHRPRVAVLSHTLAQRFFHSQSAIGRHIRIGTDPERRDIEVVGVVSDARIFDVRSPNTSVAYVPFLQEQKYIHSNSMELRTDLDATGLTKILNQAITSLGHEHAARIMTLGEVRDRALLQERIIAVLCIFFGTLALLLASIGLYGLLSYKVTQQTREIGVRMALGASRVSVFRMVLRYTLILVFIGLVIGIPSALAASRLIAHMLFGVMPWDPVTLLVVVAALVIVGILASLLPARRASALDPVVALRDR